jgi:hypothetical protein
LLPLILEASADHLSGATNLLELNSNLLELTVTLT